MKNLLIIISMFLAISCGKGGGESGSNYSWNVMPWGDDWMFREYLDDQRVVFREIDFSDERNIIVQGVRIDGVYITCYYTGQVVYETHMTGYVEVAYKSGDVECLRLFGRIGIDMTGELY